MRKMWKSKMFLSLLVFGCLFASLFQPVFAQEVTLSNLSLEIYDYPAPGASFRLFRVASLNENVNYEQITYELTSDFSATNVKLDSDLATEDDWKTAAEELETYALENNLTPAAKGTVDEAGSLKFDGLSAGLYLLVGDKQVNPKDGKIYEPQPVLAVVPGLTSTKRDDLKNAEGNVRIKLKWISIDNAPISIEAVKTWINNSSVAQPDTVTVSLLMDGEVKDTQVLSAANNWRFVWKDLDPLKTYTVKEVNIPSGYDVSVVRESNNAISYVYRIVNTAKKPSENPPKDEPKSPVPTQLLSTGQNWWPVWILAAIGLALVIKGLIQRKHA